MARGRSRSGLLTSCPACGSEMFFRKRPTRGQFVTCHNCDSLLEVLRLSPLELEWAFEDPLDVDYSDRRSNGYENGQEWDIDDYAGYEENESYDDDYGNEFEDRDSRRGQHR